MSIEQALEIRNGIPGIIVAPILLPRLGLKVGDELTLGDKIFEIRAQIVVEPDAGSSTFSLGPRVMTYTSSLQNSGLLKTGTVFRTNYAMRLKPGIDLEAVKSLFTDYFTGNGMRWRDRRDAAPGISSFVERISSFLLLVSLAGLTIGGLGIANSVNSFMSTKETTIATFKTLGATQRVIFLIYLSQILVFTGLGIVLGTFLGACVAFIIGPLISETIALPLKLSLHPKPFLEATAYGILVSLIFSIFPLEKAVSQKVASLYRNRTENTKLLTLNFMSVTVFVCVAVILCIPAMSSPFPLVSVGFAAGFFCCLVIILVASFFILKISKKIAQLKILKGWIAIKLAFSAIGNSGHENRSILLSMGLALTIITTIGQIDKNLQRALTEDLPSRAPAYFLIDIQNHQKQSLIELLDLNPQVEKIRTAPMLRGLITEINDTPLSELKIDHWALRGDRGVTYQSSPTPETKLISGEWWPEKYTGHPQISFSFNEAQEIGLNLGDKITLNLMGRDLTGEITSFRDVDFSTMGINFLMVFNPGALELAPHSHIATVYANKTAEAQLSRSIANSFPNITAVPVRETILTIKKIINSLADTMKWGALITILMGFAVIIGTAAASERNRMREAAILKTLGATRIKILTTFALRSSILGAFAGILAVTLGTLASWSTVKFVMASQYSFDPISASIIIITGILTNLISGFVFSVNATQVNPAKMLRFIG